MKSIEIIKQSVLEINKQLKKNNKITFKKNFEILGPKSNLDSLVIVNLFIAIEDKIKAVKGKEINLFREDFFEKALKNSYTIADLENHLKKNLK